MYPKVLVTHISYFLSFCKITANNASVHGLSHLIFLKFYYPKNTHYQHTTLCLRKKRHPFCIFLFAIT